MASLTLVELQVGPLRPLVLEIPPGACVTLSGPSGSGKTRLLRAIADLDPHTGDARVDGELRSRLPAPAWRRRVGLLLAESAWWAPRVGDHFTAPAGELLQALGLPEAALGWSVERLSSGERQRLALARLLAPGPEVLLLDEPTANLDRANTERVEALIAHYRAERSAAVLWVSHDPEQRRRLGGRELVIGADGAIAWT